MCISLIRAVNGVGEISLDRILLDLQLFDPNFDDLVDFVTNFKDGVYSPYSFKWNSDLSGVEGFFINIKDFLVNYFVGMFKFFVDFVRLIWELLTEGFAFMSALFNLVFETVGFST